MRIAIAALFAVATAGCEADIQCTPDTEVRAYFESGVLSCFKGRLVSFKDPDGTPYARCACPPPPQDQDGGQ